MAEGALLAAIAELTECAAEVATEHHAMDRLDEVVSLSEDAAILGRALMVISVRTMRRE